MVDYITHGTGRAPFGNTPPPVGSQASPPNSPPPTTIASDEVKRLHLELSLCRDDFDAACKERDLARAEAGLLARERDEWKWAARHWSDRYKGLTSSATFDVGPDLDRVLTKTATATMLCDKCKCPIFGGPGGYHTVDGREGCPASWDPADAYHEPASPCDLCGGSGSIIGDHTSPLDGDYADFGCPDC